MKEGEQFQLGPSRQGRVAEKPGLKIEPLVIRVYADGNVPVMMTNKTDKTFRLRRGEVLGKLETFVDIAKVGVDPNDQKKNETLKVPEQFST